MPALQAARSPGFVFLVVATAVLAASWLIATSTAFLVHPTVLGSAIALDIAVVIPAAYWATIVRRRLASARTLIPVIALSILAASALLPTTSTGVLVWARYLLSPAEIGLAAYVVWKVRAVRLLRGASSTDDPLTSIYAATYEIVGNAFAARLIASELAMLFYAVASWRHRPGTPAGVLAFAPARAAILLIVLIPMVVLETVGVHLLLSQWSATAAWVLTGLSGYTVLWLVGDYRALVMRPTLVTGDELVIRIGLRCSLRVPLPLIERAQASDWRGSARSVPGHLNMASPDTPNVLIVLRQPLPAQRLFGLTTIARSVAFRVQDPDALLKALRSRTG